jgi:hypothetical protein
MMYLLIAAGWFACGLIFAAIIAPGKLGEILSPKGDSAAIAVGCIAVAHNLGSITFL